ncbi:UDP-glucuronosyl/UDP-glucosyltransferase [Corchorus olitorius]|uniref:UDP-glucuronosyl/UDP-glucosyltransferase n=1 Tax=Corchorus olitorius TaxID=93759 RepID=A0A1R3JA20_9ROSI|nr:UDP-glucuronosyl/UDP-glucosyltransferase [Corchorus olitorius]
MDRKEKLHIAVFPWLAYGHLMPFLQVSKFLAQKGHRISYISTPKNISRLPKLTPHDLSSNNITFIELPFPQNIDGLPPGAESTGEIPVHKVPYLKKAYDLLQVPLTEFLKTSDVNWIIHDLFPYWLSGIATPLGINLVLHSTCNATTHAFFGPPSALLGDVRSRPEDFTKVPEWIDYPCNNIIAYKLYEMVTHYECMDEDVSDLYRIGMVIQGCQFVSLRSSSEFEPDEIQLLRKLYQKPVVPIGLLPPSLISSNLGKSTDEKWEGIKKWLDNKGEKSVFYVALGSEVNLSQEFMHDFGRALVLFSGASSDQGLNARLLLGKKVGLEIERNELDGSFTSELVAQTIRKVMVEPEGEPLRANAWAMREIFGNEEMSNNSLEEFARFIEEFAPSAGQV